MHLSKKKKLCKKMKRSILTSLAVLDTNYSNEKIETNK